MFFKKKPEKNILVIATDKHIGDLVLSLFAINELKKYFKGKRFYLVIDSRLTDIIKTINGMDNILLYPRKQLMEESFMNRLFILSGFLRKLRNIRPDIAIDLHGRVSSSTITFLSGAPLRIGHSNAKRAFLYNRKIHLVDKRHKFYSYLEIASAAGVQAGPRSYHMNALEGWKTSVMSILKKEHITMNKPVICIHPGAGVIYKKWTVDGFAGIADWLIAKDFQVVFVGGGNDLQEINKIISMMKHTPHNLGDKLSIGELIAFFEISSLFIGNDSGPMHLASAAGTPVIALFGSGNETRWGPLTERSIVLRGAERCEKCKRKECEHDFRCIKRITPDDVKNAIEKIIDFK